MFIPNNNDHMSQQSSIFHMQFFSEHDGLYYMMYIVWWTSSNPLIFSASNIPWNGHTLKFGCTMILVLQKLPFFLTWIKRWAWMQAHFAKSFRHFPTRMQVLWSMVVAESSFEIVILIKLTTWVRGKRVTITSPAGHFPALFFAATFCVSAKPMINETRLKGPMIYGEGFPSSY